MNILGRSNVRPLQPRGIGRTSHRKRRAPGGGVRRRDPSVYGRLAYQPSYRVVTWSVSWPGHVTNVPSGTTIVSIIPHARPSPRIPDAW